MTLQLTEGRFVGTYPFPSRALITFVQMVVIVDPHLKRANDYPVYREASELELMIKQKDGKTEYEGWCWSGSSAWLDMFNPNVWDWWKSLFIFDPNAKKISKWSWLQSTEAVHLWNDMNEVNPFDIRQVEMILMSMAA